MAEAEQGIAEVNRNALPGESDADELLVGLVEAMLYAADGPLSAADLLEVIRKVANDGQADREGVDVQSIERACVALGDRYVEVDSALHVIQVAGGFRLGTRTRFDKWIRALRQVETPTQLSMQALETLAVIAYRQPVTLAEIASIRGVDPTSALRTLREQRMVRVIGRKRSVGRPFTYGTTRQFLLTFGLRDLDELPAPEEFEELLEG